MFVLRVPMNVYVGGRVVFFVLNWNGRPSMATWVGARVREPRNARCEKAPLSPTLCPPHPPPPPPQVLTIGATNLAQELDQALLRPGRFEVVYEIPSPGPTARMEILKYHSRWGGGPRRGSFQTRSVFLKVPLAAYSCLSGIRLEPRIMTGILKQVCTPWQHTQLHSRTQKHAHQPMHPPPPRNKPLDGEAMLTRVAEVTQGWSAAALANLMNEAAILTVGYLKRGA